MKTALQAGTRHSAICNLKFRMLKGTLVANDRTKYILQMKTNRRLLCITAMTSLLLTHSNHTTMADEGMWLFNNPPRKQLKEKYGFDITDSWLDHVQKSSVRFNSGGSGSFVSEDGLVMSNHHVGADALQKFGDKDHNYLRDGFQV